uniref:tyrosinase-like n=1 Tax=Pristiophorus japonicus TaxID=55135 RepID=UPI00398F8111
MALRLATRLVLLLRLAVAGGQVPIQCATAEHLRAGECCPLFWGDGSPCGEASRRGRCREASPGGGGWGAEGGWRGRPAGRDFRLRWPAYFYRRLCACAGNFAGADCGECRPGWRGAGCGRPYTVVRRDLARLSPAQRRLFVERLAAAKRTPSQRYAIYASPGPAPGAPLAFRRASVYHVATWMHYVLPKPVPGGEGVIFAHRSTAFPTWHKMYLLHLEAEIRNMTGDDTFFIPVWSWAGKGGCDVCTDELFGRSGPGGWLSRRSVFGSWRTYCTSDGGSQMTFDLVCPPGLGRGIRRFERHDPRFSALPTLADVDACLRLHTFDRGPFNSAANFSFRSALEGFIDPQRPDTFVTSMHNLVHVYCGGTLNNIFEATNDPLFPSLHAFVDLIFERWLRRHPGTRYPSGPPQGHRGHDWMVPFLPLVQNQDLMRGARFFGYDYEID